MHIMQLSHAFVLWVSMVINRPLQPLCGLMKVFAYGMMLCPTFLQKT
jgi:hypothetical protein